VEKDGERQLNIGAIARRASVSTATVSRTLNQSQYDIVLTSTDYKMARMTGCVRRMD
jgi:hypothetical protein